MELENADIQKVILNFQGQKSLFFSVSTYNSWEGYRPILRNLYGPVTLATQGAVSLESFGALGGSLQSPAERGALLMIQKSGKNPPPGIYFQKLCKSLDKVPNKPQLGDLRIYFNHQQLWFCFP